MANRTWHQAKTLDREVITLYGRVNIGATGAVASQTSLGFTVTRTGTGAYRVTLEDKYPELLDGDCTPRHTVVDTHVQMVAEDMAAGTIDFLHKSAGGAADPASGSSLFFRIVLKNSTVGP